MDKGNTVFAMHIVNYDMKHKNMSWFERTNIIEIWFYQKQNGEEKIIIEAPYEDSFDQEHREELVVNYKDLSARLSEKIFYEASLINELNMDIETEKTKKIIEKCDNKDEEDIVLANIASLYDWRTTINLGTYHNNEVNGVIMLHYYNETKYIAELVVKIVKFIRSFYENTERNIIVTEDIIFDPISNVFFQI